jgi:hypothetical protein
MAAKDRDACQTGYVSLEVAPGILLTVTWSEAGWMLDSVELPDAGTFAIDRTDLARVFPGLTAAREYFMAKYGSRLPQSGPQ